jgi:hypothetical protein
MGNRALGPVVQAKLNISHPHDAYEQEADRVADQVMRMADTTNGHEAVDRSLQTIPHIQRMCSDCEEEEASQTTVPQIQRKCAACADDEIHRMSAGQEENEEKEEKEEESVQLKPAGGEVSEAGSDLERGLSNRVSGQPLSSAVRAFFEPRFGADFSNVRVHNDAQSIEFNRALNAQAFTTRENIYYGAGKAAANDHLTAHELAHVVQQSGHARSIAKRGIAGRRPALSPLPQPNLQRTVFTPGVPHNHQPSGRWSEVQSSPNSSFFLGWICGNSTPRMVADTAMDWQFCDKPLGLRHLQWYLGGSGADFPENENFDRFVRTSEHFRRNFAVARRGLTRGYMQVPQSFFGPSDEDFRYSFGAIDRLDFEVDEIAGTVHLWFKDRYEFHPVYPFYTRFADDEVRETNCVHAAMVELKAQRAADYWMVGETTVPARLFTFSASDILDEERAESVRGAISFLDLLRQQLQVDRMRARAAAAAAAGIADASRRAHLILNQAGIRGVLQRGKRIYDAQRTLLHWGHPLLGRFREVYFNFLSEVLGAFNESLALSRNDRAAETEEQTAYGENLVLWMEASPMREAAMAGQATFTTTFQSQEANLTSVLTNFVPNLNLAQPGMPARAREAINRAVGRTPSLLTDPARTWATGPVPGLADAALAQIDQAEQTMDRGRSLLRVAIARLDLWLQAPTQPIDVADRVDELFHTRDVGYGQLLRDRLQLMLTNIEGGGRLFAHTHSPADTSNCTTPTVLGQMPQPYEFVFCRFSTNLDSNASTMLHELAHAVIPGRGSRGSAETGAPIDRAYSGERLMLRMTTEEALNNAESYAQLIVVLAGVPVTAVSADVVTGCADSGTWLDAMAVAQSAHRRAWSYLESAQAALAGGTAIQSWLRDLINTHLGSPSDTALSGMLTDFGNLQAEGSLWHIGHTFSCPPARACPSNALAFDNRRIYRSGAVASRSRSGSSDPRICPAFFSLGSPDDRARAAHVIVSLSFGNSILIHPDRAWGYAALALALYRRDIGAAPAASLAEHQAADQPPSP